MNVGAHAGEIRVNIGGDAGRDDYGLPPVDIEIPDDARELDREVLAYHRELRALRWRRRTHRLAGPLARDGMVLPLLAGCLALTLLAGTLLTVFSSAPLISPSAGQPGHQLPDTIVLVNGVQTPVRELKGSVLALVPPHCRCGHLRQLALEANSAAVQIWIVGTHGIGVTDLVKRTGLGASHAVEDIDNILASTYHPKALTAVLVKANGAVARIVADRGPGFQLTSAMRSLTPAATKQPRPGGSAVASAPASPAGS
jgi:hypothetical protein